MTRGAASKTPKASKQAGRWWLAGVVLLVLAGLGIGVMWAMWPAGRELAGQEPAEQAPTSGAVAQSVDQNGPAAVADNCERAVDNPACALPGDVQNPGVSRVSFDEFTQAVGPELVHGDRKSKLISWTFDAGEGAETLDQILTVLAANKISATFFITGRWAERFPEQLQRLVQAGHEVANHSYDHPDFTKLTADNIRYQLERTEGLLGHIGRVSPKPLFRYPYGARNLKTRAAIEAAGYKSVFWSLDTIDWREKPAVVKQRVLEKVQGGDVILSHVGAASTGPVFAGIVKELLGRGYQLVTVSELIRAQAANAAQVAP